MPVVDLSTRVLTDGRCVCDDRQMARRHGGRVIDSVMEELQGFLNAVGALETQIAEHFGVERGDLRWLSALAETPEGMTRPELLVISGVAPDVLESKLEHMRAHERDGRVALDARSRQILGAVNDRIENAYVGLHRYGAEELGVVRTFLRVGRHFYERQGERFARGCGLRPASPP